MAHQRNNFETTLTNSSKNKFKALFEAAPVAIVEGHWRKTFEVLDVNPAAIKLFQAENKEQFIAGFSHLLSKIPKKALLDLLSARLKQQPFEAEFRLPNFRKQYVYVLMRLGYLKSADLLADHVVLTFQDITSRKLHEHSLSKLSQIDGLTEVFNQRTILKRLDEELSRAKRYDLDLSCIIFDLDNFKAVNDTFGHLYGDKCLKRAVKFLKMSLRKTDIVGRYGGDEFLVILPETKMEQAEIPVDRFFKSYAPKAKIQFKGKSVITSFSVGISGYPGPGIETVKNLIHAADRALYQSKISGGNQFHLYTPKQS